ncbi:Piwi domain-containing protein [Fimicolochytrium jonesii]|uniref:Piwi domain-containing protein n=1 Tax=Fimicolochytrium jonesii TaxID=1396493 RepID=UPI0022FEBBFA|nr:Piwi domain-containing protein [Fimicolochytrium jonesii]KAI8824387.1 Piwi domain-containing protein [Fimicolochytrium jonesii]
MSSGPPFGGGMAGAPPIGQVYGDSFASTSSNSAFGGAVHPYSQQPQHSQYADFQQPSLLSHTPAPPGPPLAFRQQQQAPLQQSRLPAAFPTNAGPSLTPVSGAIAPASTWKYPRRPDVGTAGRQIQVRANFFPILNFPKTMIHHYDVAILPDVPPAKNRRIYQIWEQALKSGKWKGPNLGLGPSSVPQPADLGDRPFIPPVFDGRKNVYSIQDLGLPEGIDSVYELDYFEDEEAKVRGGRKFTMAIRKVGEIDMQRLAAFLEGRTGETPYDCMAAMDILLRHRPSLTYTTIGRCFYTADSATTIANGAQLWQGFHQSVRPAQGQMLINLDVSATAFYQPGPVVEIVARILGRHDASELRTPLNERDRQKVEKALKGLKIVVTHRGQIRRKFRISKITSTPANRTMFALEESGAETSVAGFFQSKYNHTLYFPHLPCLVVGDPARQVFLPLEVCDIMAGQRHLRKLNEKQTAEMIKFTCQPPHVRSNKISAGITLLQQRDNEYLRDFGVQIGHEMAIVNARVLPAPSISYHPASKEPIITPREGAWNLRDKMVAQGVTIRSWSVIAFGQEHDYPIGAIQKFVTLLVQTCEECGVFIANRQPPISYANPHGNIEKALIDAYMLGGQSFSERPQLVVCILPNTGVPLYAEIKRVSDTVIGVATQCVQAKHMFAAKRQYCANVCLKLNVKLGGMNSYLSNTQLPFIAERPTIIIGADMTHPTPGSASNQSIAAVVGSMDAQCSRFAASIRVQKGKSDSIRDLSGMIIELLKTFYQTCGAKPERMVYYRDGIADPHVAEVLAYETAAIRQACDTLEPGYCPTITFVVVQKRHHARFFPIRKEDSDRSGNILPGTAIAHGVTHPSEFDFYLCSHPGLQGTSKPTHYHVLLDENKFTSDGMLELTYRLCYLYCRATRSVSVVPPAYYAHLVAARARFHAFGEGTWELPATKDHLIFTKKSASAAAAAEPYVASPLTPVGGMATGAEFGDNLHTSLSSLSLSSIQSAQIPSVAAAAGGKPGASANVPPTPWNGRKAKDGPVRVMNYGTVKEELSRVMYFM